MGGAERVEDGAGGGTARGGNHARAGSEGLAVGWGAGAVRASGWRRRTPPLPSPALRPSSFPPLARARRARPCRRRRCAA
eukprot:94151-Prymnesium_polylepis.1